MSSEMLRVHSVDASSAPQTGPHVDDRRHTYCASTDHFSKGTAMSRTLAASLAWRGSSSDTDGFAAFARVVPPLAEASAALSEERASLKGQFDLALAVVSKFNISLEQILMRCAEGTCIVVPPLDSSPNDWVILRRTGDSVFREVYEIRSNKSVMDTLGCDLDSLFTEHLFERNHAMWAPEQRNEYDRSLALWTSLGTPGALSEECVRSRSPKPDASFDDLLRMYLSARIVGASIVMPTPDSETFTCAVMTGHDQSKAKIEKMSVTLDPGENLTDAMQRVNPRYFASRPLLRGEQGLQRAFDESTIHLGDGAFGSVRRCTVNGNEVAIKKVIATGEAIEKRRAEIADLKAQMPKGLLQKLKNPGRTLSLRRQKKELKEKPLLHSSMSEAMRTLSPETVAVRRLDASPHMGHVQGFEVINAENMASTVLAEAPCVYMAMPLAEGGTLDALKKLSPAEAAAWGLQLFGALADLHAHGVAHRDIKPENLGRQDKKLLVLDLGGSHDFHDDRASVEICGTPGFISAWQLMSQDDAREAKMLSAEDVFAAAVTVGIWAYNDTPALSKKYGGLGDPADSFAFQDRMVAADGELDWARATLECMTPDLLRAFYEETMVDGPGKPELITLLISALNPDPRLRPAASEMACSLTYIAAFA